MIPSSPAVIELIFADDAAAVGTTRESMERAAQALEEVTSEWGLTVSVPKTKLLVADVHCEETDLQPIYTRGGATEAVTEFKSLTDNKENGVQGGCAVCVVAWC